MVLGVYIMQDKTNTVIYVGKAKKLKNRVSQYFQGFLRPYAENPADGLADRSLRRDRCADGV